jgi:hypothetical protein
MGNPKRAPPLGGTGDGQMKLSVRMLQNKYFQNVSDRKYWQNVEEQKK